MKDTDFYQHVLGLREPWSVSKIELDIKAQRLDGGVEHPKDLKCPCPECEVEGALYDHAEEQVWRHLDSCQFQTLLHARPPRVKWPEHGVRQVRLPWAEAHARFSLLFEQFAIIVLRQTTIQATTQILRISWDEAWHLVHRAVQRGLRRKPQWIVPQIGVEEKSAAWGQKRVERERRYVQGGCAGKGEGDLRCGWAGRVKLLRQRGERKRRQDERWAAVLGVLLGDDKGGCPDEQQGEIERGSDLRCGHLATLATSCLNDLPWVRDPGFSR